MATTLRLWLPDDLKQFVDQRVREGGYVSGPEYMRDLIRRQLVAVKKSLRKPAAGADYS
ncbi:MAG TPA: ribbon-helix-helix domain-containing protein [Solimonas sp.]|nr:ribbon-helix-helix domain-containing protein [Solimonas sp.]